MLQRGLFLIVLIPLIELALLTQLMQQTSLLTTIAIVLSTGVIGVSLTRQQGLKAWRGVHTQLSQGRSPSKEILDGVMILLAGAFLITPGLLTDVVGFSLLVPAIRRTLGTRLTKWFLASTTAKFTVQGWPGQAAPDSELEEGPSVRVVDPQEQTPPPSIE